MSVIAGGSQVSHDVQEEAPDTVSWESGATAEWEYIPRGADPLQHRHGDERGEGSG